MKRTIWIAAVVVGAFVGQVEASTLCIAHLSGDEVVPPVDTPARGLGIVELNDDMTAATVTLSAADLLGPTFATHIHQGPPGVNGFVAFGIDGLSCFNPGVYRTWDNGTPFSPLNYYINSLLNGNLYFAVHTDSYPGGELRGQIYCQQ
jgi:hypothetical protein